MLITLLERDRNIFEQSEMKLKHPYLNMLEDTMMAILKDRRKARDYMKEKNMKVHKISQDENFTMYSFINKGILMVNLTIFLIDYGT
jgi:hypothetical protein